MNQRRQRRLRIEPVACRVGLELFDVDTQRRAAGAGAGQPVDDARAVGKTDAQALVARDAAVIVRDTAKEVLKKAEAEKSAVDGKTFGDLLKDGKLPASK